MTWSVAIRGFTEKVTQFDFSCVDWEDRLRDGRSLIPDLPINPTKAHEAANLFNVLRLPDVPGEPMLAEAAGEWFREIVVTTFAAEDPDTGRQLVSELFCLVPKKNSKTTYSAALGLTALLHWERPNAQLLILGPTQNVADRCFNQAAGMIAADERLEKVFHVQDHLKKITRRKTGATLQVKTFDLNVVTGEIPALTIIDELHVVAAKSYADRVIAQITGGMVTNPDAKLVYITTQSDVRPRGVFKTKLDYARKVRDGEITDAGGFLPVLYEFPERIQRDDDRGWRDPNLWHMVTPNLGLSVKLDLLRRNFTKAEEEGPESLTIWASQHLNVQVGMGTHDDRWAGSDYWQAAADPDMTLDSILATSEVCTIGVDPGGHDDLLGMCLIGRHSETGVWQVWTRSWADRIVLERRKSIASALRDFEKDEDLVIVDDLETEGYLELAEICTRVRDLDLLPDEASIGVDAAGKAAGLVVDTLVDSGFAPGRDLKPVAQGYRLNNVVALCAIKLKSRSMRHADQPIMAWCVGNAKTELRQNAEIITKAESGVGKIDPLMAMFNAAELMSLHPRAASNTVSIPSGYMVA